MNPTPLNAASPFPLGGSPLGGFPFERPAAAGPLSPAGPGLPMPVTPASRPDPVGGAFLEMLQQTAAAEHTAQSAIETGLLGGDVTQAEVMAAVKKADLSVRMLMQVRNKVIGAYNEIQAMKF